MAPAGSTATYVALARTVAAGAREEQAPQKASACQQDEPAVAEDPAQEAGRDAVQAAAAPADARGVAAYSRRPPPADPHSRIDLFHRNCYGSPRTQDTRPHTQRCWNPHETCRVETEPPGPFSPGHGAEAQPLGRRAPRGRMRGCRVSGGVVCLLAQVYDLLADGRRVRDDHRLADLLLVMFT